MAIKQQTKSKLKNYLNQFTCGDAIEVARKLPAESVDCIVTSPPYFQQRDYGSKLQIGQEASPAAYVQRLVELFEALKRLLKPTGAAWIVIGDKYLAGQLLGMPWRLAICFTSFFDDIVCPLLLDVGFNAT